VTYSGDELVLDVEFADDGFGGFGLDNVELCLTEHISCLA